MDDNSAKECGVCNHDFDEEDYSPRILPCTHCLCGACINRLIRDNKKCCPFCRQDFQGRSDRDFGRNTYLLELLKYVAKLEQEKALAEQNKETSQKALQHTYNKSIADLREAKVKIQKQSQATLELFQDVMKNTRDIENNLLRSISEILSKNHDELDCLTEIKKITDVMLRKVTEKEQQLMEARNKCLEGSTYTDFGEGVDTAEETNSSIKKEMQIVNIVISANWKTHQNIKKRADESKEKLAIAHDVVRSFSEENNGHETVHLNPHIQQRLLRNYIQPDKLKSRSADVINLVKQGRLFAIQRLHGIRRSARITLNGETKLLLHCLREGPPPPGAFITYHKDVLKMVDITKRKTFLVISSKQSKLGVLSISLLSKMKLADQFYILCSGEIGHSYMNSVFLGRIDKGTANESIAFGDYANNDGRAESATSLMPGMTKEGGKRMVCFAGALEGVWYPSQGGNMSAQVGIFVRDNSNKTLEAVFGRVDKGLNILTNAVSQYPDVRAISIIDCGIILPW